MRPSSIPEVRVLVRACQLRVLLGRKLFDEVRVAVITDAAGHGHAEAVDIAAETEMVLMGGKVLCF